MDTNDWLGLDLGVIFDRVTPEVAAAVRAGERVAYLPFRETHLQVHQTALGVLVTVNGIGDIEDLFEYVPYDQAVHAESFVHRLVAEWIRKDAHARAGAFRVGDYFRSWGKPGERVAVERDFDGSHWYVVVDDTVHTHTPDAVDQAARMRAGWDFVEHTLAAAGTPLPEHEQLLAAAAVER